MGFHLILRKLDGSIEHRYSAALEDLCEFSDITPDAIIYQGEEHWKPVVVGSTDVYAKLTHDWFRAGIKAQRLFKAQARAANFIAEPISQDAESFEPYRSASDKRLKRGDFLIRNAGIEVEVKCLTKYGGKFYLRWSDLKAHENMQALTRSPVFFAIYERSGDTPNPETLCMVPVTEILAENNKSVTYDRESKCALIPFGLTSVGFSRLRR